MRGEREMGMGNGRMRGESQFGKRGGTKRERSEAREVEQVNKSTSKNIGGDLVCAGEEQVFAPFLLRLSLSLP